MAHRGLEPATFGFQLTSFPGILWVNSTWVLSHLSILYVKVFDWILLSRKHRTNADLLVVMQWKCRFPVQFGIYNSDLIYDIASIQTLTFDITLIPSSFYTWCIHTYRAVCYRRWICGRSCPPWWAHSAAAIVTIIVVLVRSNWTRFAVVYALKFISRRAENWNITIRNR